ncbi:hypothetical protein [Rhodobacter sp. NSM]|uniref:hypothetical protein n=1 Tax=Rhodobacter sp. NSM TaxID=3457501 RepID=UPI003FD5E034
MSSFRTLTACLFAPCIASFATGAQAGEEWFHATAPMAQFEGGYGDHDADFGIGYGCSTIGSSLDIDLKGNHVGTGTGRITIDGTVLTDAPITFDATRGTTRMAFHSSWKDSPAQRAAYDRVIAAIASGRAMSVRFGDGTDVPVPLKNSSAITSCLVR